MLSWSSTRKRGWTEHAGSLAAVLLLGGSSVSKPIAVRELEGGERVPWCQGYGRVWESSTEDKARLCRAVNAAPATMNVGHWPATRESAELLDAGRGRSESASSCPCSGPAVVSATDARAALALLPLPQLRNRESEFTSIVMLSWQLALDCGSAFESGFGPGSVRTAKRLPVCMPCADESRVVSSGAWATESPACGSGLRKSTMV